MEKKIIIAKAPIPDYANYPYTRGFPPKSEYIPDENGRVTIGGYSETSLRTCSVCDKEFYDHMFKIYYSGKPVCPPCREKSRNK